MNNIDIQETVTLSQKYTSLVIDYFYDNLLPLIKNFLANKTNSHYEDYSLGRDGYYIEILPCPINPIDGLTAIFPIFYKDLPNNLNKEELNKIIEISWENYIKEQKSIQDRIEKERKDSILKWYRKRLKELEQERTYNEKP